MLIRFILYGLGGWCGEVIFTATRDRLRGAAQNLRGLYIMNEFKIQNGFRPSSPALLPRREKGERA